MIYICIHNIYICPLFDHFWLPFSSPEPYPLEADVSVLRFNDCPAQNIIHSNDLNASRIQFGHSQIPLKWGSCLAVVTHSTFNVQHSTFALNDNCIFIAQTVDEMFINGPKHKGIMTSSGSQLTPPYSPLSRSPCLAQLRLKLISLLKCIYGWTFVSVSVFTVHTLHLLTISSASGKNNTHNWGDSRRFPLPLYTPLPLPSSSTL